MEVIMEHWQEEVEQTKKGKNRHIRVSMTRRHTLPLGVSHKHLDEPLSPPDLRRQAMELNMHTRICIEFQKRYLSKTPHVSPTDMEIIQEEDKEEEDEGP